MVSAYALRPGGGPFGASDLKRHARRFLERGLLISALLHLSILGWLRLEAEREAASEGPPVPRIPGVVHTWHWIPTEPPPNSTRPPGGSTGSRGVIFPVERVPPIIEGPAFSPDASPVVPGGPGGWEGPCRSDPVPPPEPPASRFQVAEEPPVAIQAPKPEYPEWAREAGVEGTVLLRALVGTDGLVKDVVIVKGPKGLDQEAARAIRRWTFQPGKSNEQAVTVWIEIPVTFRL